MPVESEADLVLALLTVGECLDSDAPERRELLHAQTVLIADWEARTAPPDRLAAPGCRVPLLDAIQAKVAEKGLAPYELRRLFHGQHWEVLTGRRPLSVPMMWGVARALDIPVETLLASRAPAPARHERARRPAVPVAELVGADYVVCLECGARRKWLRRHVRTVHGLSEWQYRWRWGLMLFHPLTAPAFSARCAARAKAQGLGGDTSRFRKRRRRRRFV